MAQLPSKPGESSCRRGKDGCTVIRKRRKGGRTWVSSTCRSSSIEARANLTFIKPEKSRFRPSPNVATEAVRGGVEHNYRVILVKDAIAEVNRNTHEAELTTMDRLSADVKTR
jgi:hypothetical protein